MKRLLTYLWLALAALLIMPSLTSCKDDYDAPSGKEPVYLEHSKTLLVYMPWSGDGSALTGFFWQNIRDIQKADSTWGAANEHVVVFICTSGSKAVMFNIDDYTGHDDASLARYRQITFDTPEFTTAEGIAKIITEMKSMAPAETYAMTVGCHGMGWLPKGAGSSGAKTHGETGETAFRPHWDYPGVATRYFGGSSKDYQTDIETFAEALSASNTHLQFLLYDDCYMSGVETAYALRHVTGYLIGCPTEVMGPGMPYATMGQYLLGEPDYAKAVEAFHTFYSAYAYPYGTISVIKTGELEQLAALAREINAQYTFNAALTGSVQKLDGYTPTLFFDYADYIDKLCPDKQLTARFDALLTKAVPYKANTPEYYSSINGGGSYNINTYSGITISEPSKNVMMAAYSNTEWYKATH